MRLHPLMKVCLQGEEGPTTNLSLGHIYKHLAATITAAGRLSQQIRRRIGQARGTFRQLAQPLFLNRALKETTRLFLLESLVFTKLLFGSGGWSGLLGADVRRLQVCYVGLLRRTLHQVKKPGVSVLSDHAILQRAQRAPILVRLAQQRLLLGARLAKHAPKFVWQELQRERADLTRSWFAELEEDLQWLQSAVSLRDWGSSLQEVSEKWQQSKSGWQRLVRLGEEDDTLLDLLRSAHCQCSCGQTFANQRALRLHRVKRHGRRTAEAGYIHGNTCSICLPHFWTKNRLDLHLRYVPRRGEPNVCASWLAEFGQQEASRDDLPDDPFEKPIGMVRMDAVTLQGPKVFGACDTDVAAYEDDFICLEESLLAQGLNFHPEPELLHTLGDEMMENGMMRQEMSCCA